MEHTYPIKRDDIGSDDEEETAVDKMNVLVTAGRTGADSGCNLSVAVKDGNAKNVYIKVQDMNNKIVGTSSTINEFDAMDFRRSFCVKNGADYKVTVIVNKGMHSEKSCLKRIYVDSGENVDSDGDGYYDYEDVNPYTKAPYCEYFSKTYTFDYLELKSEQTESDKWYGKGVYNQAELNRIYVTAAMIGGWGGLPIKHAGEAMCNYLSNTGQSKDIEVYNLIEQSKSAHENFETNLKMIKEYAGNVLKDKSKIIVGSIRPLSVHNIIYASDVDWSATIGTSKNGAIEATITRNGDEYEISYKYCVSDFYDWDKNSSNSFVGGITDGDLFKLHHAGISKHFYQYGELASQTSWTIGEN